MTNTNITQLRNNIFEYANSCINFNDIINVNTKNGNIIMMSEEEYRGMIATLEIISKPELHKSIREGMNTPREELQEFFWDD